MKTPTNEQRLHLAIIPDGNRRWARERKLEAVWKGHEVAVQNFEKLTEWCQKSGRVFALTVWCFSTENWKRDPKEISMLMDMLEQYLKRERVSLKERQIRFLHSGRRDRIPPSLRKLIEEVEEETKNETDFTLHLAVDYGGKDEVLRATEKLMRSGDASLPVTEETLRKYFDHPTLPDIDLVLRSSGEKRTSNFFLFQTAYAEWLFLEKYFPDIGTDDIANALQEYETRKRRYGS